MARRKTPVITALTRTLLATARSVPLMPGTVKTQYLCSPGGVITGVIKRASKRRAKPAFFYFFSGVALSPSAGLASLVAAVPAGLVSAAAAAGSLALSPLSCSMYGHLR